MGHLFVAQGDLTKLACDAIIIPCDDRGNVDRAWIPLLPLGLAKGDHPNWLRIEGTPNDHGVIELRSVGERSVFAFCSPYEGYRDPQEPVDRLWEALGDVIVGLRHNSCRPIPLVGIPLIGTGAGGLSGRRGEVVVELLTRHRLTQVGVDLALILLDQRDLAAVQNHRRSELDWSDLDPRLLSEADELGALAARKNLALFLGSGVSLPAGLPDWRGLLELLAGAAEIDCPPDDIPYEDAASLVKAHLGDKYFSVMQDTFDVSEYAIGHALLAGLRLDQMVTTNFDTCMELALQAIRGDKYRVLVREVASKGSAWLLKLHGDIKVPNSLVLDAADVAHHADVNGPLRGLVQGLLLTSHLLFVGFSFKDQDFLSLAEAVRRVRGASPNEADGAVGTALALTSEDAKRVKGQDLRTVVMSASTVCDAARELELFLDRLAWSALKNHDLAAEYLLDDQYETSLADHDLRLRELLFKLVNDADEEVRSSSGWPRVFACLRDLGAGSQVN